MSLLPKIQALIARAAHPETPVEEARTSAVIAARLIVEHGVVLTEKGGGRFYPSPEQREGGVPFSSIINDFVDEILRGTGGYPRQAPWYGRARRYEPPPPPPPKQKKKRGPKRRKREQSVKDRVDEAFKDWEKPKTGFCPHGVLPAFCSLCGGVPPTRRVYSATCPWTERDLACACCRAAIRPGERFCWVGEGRIYPNLTPLTHERCVRHWARDWCDTCGKRTT